VNKRININKIPNKKASDLPTDAIMKNIMAAPIRERPQRKRPAILWMLFSQVIELWNEVFRSSAIDEPPEKIRMVPNEKRNEEKEFAKIGVDHEMPNEKS
jgi:hypothetical protein